MVALRKGWWHGALAPYGLAALMTGLATTQVARQDLAALLADQPAVSDRAREHLASSPFGTIHAALFSLPQPLGTAAPPPERVMLAKFDTAAFDLPGAGMRDAVRGEEERPPKPSTVDVNRAAKGELAIPRIQIEINREIVAGPPALPGMATGDEDDELEQAVRFTPFPEYDISLSLELQPQVPTAGQNGEPGDELASADGEDPRTSFGEIRLYFEGVPMLAAPLRMEPWAPGEAPLLEGPALAAVTPEAEPELPLQAKTEPVTTAAKGEVAAEPKGLLSPAALLELSPKARAKAERCLSNAVYFEARGESVRGQIAVAQVVLNRVFSGYYPSDVCGVVYQGAHRHLSCQFTFACDGIPDVVTEQEPWERAQRIAKAALDGKIWLKDVGKATHYHASWVNPYWVRSMRRLKRIGVHSFYRPRRWGDGSEAPTWGKPMNAEIATRF